MPLLGVHATLTALAAPQTANKGGVCWAPLASRQRCLLAEDCLPRTVLAWVFRKASVLRVTAACPEALLRLHLRFCLLADHVGNRRSLPVVL